MTIAIAVFGRAIEKRSHESMYKTDRKKSKEEIIKQRD